MKQFEAELLEVFRKSVDAQNSNAFDQLYTALQRLASSRPKKSVSLSMLVRVVAIVADEWDKEIDDYLNMPIN